MSFAEPYLSAFYFSTQVVVSTEKMWVPTDTTAEKDLNYIQSNFGPLNRAGSVLFTAKESIGKNVLTLAAFETLWDVHEKIVNEAVGKGDHWQDMCFTRNPQGLCGVYGVLQFFNGNRTYYNSVVKNQANLLTFINKPTFEGGPIAAGGTPVLPNQIFGKVTRNNMQAIVAAEATVQFYFIQQQPIERALAWEKSFDDVTKDSSTPQVNVYHVATSSVDNALSNLDTWPLMALYGIVIVIMLIALQRSASFAGFRFGLAAVGLGLIALANVAGYGICSGLGVASVTIITVLPMIIIAVGVNDMFIITAAFDAQDSSLCIEDRLAGAMRRCGKSIGFTAVAAATAFYLGGGLSRFFAVRQFCYYAGTAILCNYVLMVTFFCAAMAIDTQRREAQRWDLLVCVTSPRTQQAVQPFEHVQQDEENLDNALPAASAPPAEPAIAAVKYSDPNSPDSPVNAKAKAVGTRAVGDLNYLEYFFSEVYYPVLRHPVARLCVVAAFAGLFVANVFGVYRVRQDFEVTQIIPPREPVHQAVVHAREMGLYAPEQSAPVVIAYGNLDYHEQEVQEEIVRLQNEFLANTDYNKAPMASWMTSFITFVRTPGTPYYNFINADKYLVNPAIFYTAVKTFITNVPAARRFKADIVFINNPAGVPIGILSSRANSFHNNLKGPIAITNSMRHAREVMSNSSLVETPRVFAAPYTRAEGFEISVREVIAYYVAVLVAVTGVTFLVVRPHSVVLSLLALVLVAMTMVNFTGNMAWWGLKLDINFISMIFVSLSTALVVDYILHVLHHYSQQPTALPPLLRLKETMVCIGPSILKGGLTMLVAIIPLAFGRHYVFYVFFRMTFCMIVYSLGHALFLLPAVLPTISYLMCETVGSKGATAKAVEKDSGVEMLEAGAGEGKSSVDVQVVKTDNDEVVAFVHQDH